MNRSVRLKTLKKWARPGNNDTVARRRLRRRVSGGLLLLVALALAGGMATVLTPTPQVAVADESASALLRTGKQLFDTSCVSCHGANLQGEAGRGPSLIGVGEAAVAGMLDDYAFMTWGLLELYEATLEPGVLKTALELADNTISHFHDDRDGGFFFTADDGERLLVRQKDSYDGAIPSGNSVMMLNLLRLSRITGRQDLESKAIGVARAAARGVAQIPSAYSQLMVALEFLAGPPAEIVVAGKPGAPDTQAMLDAVRRSFLPNRVLLFRPEGAASGPITDLAPFTRDMKAGRGRAAAYVCRNYACAKPVFTVKEMLGLLEAP